MWVVLLVCPALFFFGCLSEDGGSTGSTGDEDANTETDDSSAEGENNYPDPCSGACSDTDASFCVNSRSLCECDGGAWSTLNCTTYCTDMGGTHLGCGAGGNGEIACMCSGGGDEDEEEEQRVPFNDPGCRGWDFPVKTQYTRYVTDDGEPYWLYIAYSRESTPLDILQVTITPSSGGLDEAGTVVIEEADTKYETCANCVVLRKNCTVDSTTQALVCERFYMPRAGSKLNISNIDTAVGTDFIAQFDSMYLEEVTISQTATERVEDGESWCFDLFDIDSYVTEDGYVHMEKPENLPCDYPDGPYYFMGPEQGQSSPAPGTVPPMAWPGAYYNGEVVGFDLGSFRCEHPEVKTLFVAVMAGWCSACKSFMKEYLCNEGGYIDQLDGLSAEFLFVVGDMGSQGVQATDLYANQYIDYYHCEGGYRTADTDNSSGERVVWRNDMSDSIPFVAAIRLSDMKLIATQGEYILDFVGIAQSNLAD